MDRTRKILPVIVVVIAVACVIAAILYSPSEPVDIEPPPKPSAIAWQFRTEGSCTAKPTFLAGELFVSSDAKEIFCLQAATGRKKWTFTAGDEIKTSPVVFGDRIILGSIDKNIYCLDLSGTEIWRFAADGEIYCTPAIRTAPDRAASVVFGTLGQTLYSIDLRNGREQWRFSAGGYIIGTPAVCGDKIIFTGCNEGAIYILKADTGELFKKVQLESDGVDIEYLQADVAPFGGDAIIASMLGNVMRISGLDGKIVWRTSIGGEMYAMPLVSGGHVYAISTDDVLWKIDLADGKRGWSFAIRQSGKGTPMLVGSDVVISGDDGWVYVVGPDGTERWSYEVGGYLGTPIFYDGLIVLGSDDGHVYAIKAPPEVWSASSSRPASRPAGG